MTARILLLVMFLGAPLSASAVPQVRIRNASTPAKGGWWLRIDTKATKAASIQWELGTNPKKLTEKATWTAGGAAEMDLPEIVRKENLIHMQAITAPGAATVVMCVFYQQQGVARIEFNGTDGRQLNQKTKEPKCTP